MSQECLHDPSSVPLSKNEPGNLETDGPLITPSNTSPHTQLGIYTRVSFRKMNKGDKIILRENLGGRRDCV